MRAPAPARVVAAEFVDSLAKLHDWHGAVEADAVAVVHHVEEKHLRRAILPQHAKVLAIVLLVQVVGGHGKKGTVACSCHCMGVGAVWQVNLLDHTPLEGARSVDQLDEVETQGGANKTCAT